MDKICEALRKIASEVSSAQTTNSEYFKIGPIEVRVSDHTCSHMSTISPFKMFILTDTGKRNIYTVCYGQDVKACTYTEVRAICKAFSLLSTPLNKFFKGEMKSSSVMSFDSADGSMKSWNKAVICSDTAPLVALIKEHLGFDISNYSQKSINKIRNSYTNGTKGKDLTYRLAKVVEAIKILGVV